MRGWMMEVPASSGGVLAAQKFKLVMCFTVLAGK